MCTMRPIAKIERTQIWVPVFNYIRHSRAQNKKQWFSAAAHDSLHEALKVLGLGRRGLGLVSDPAFVEWIIVSVVTGGG